MKNYFADNCRYLRKQKGLTQTELGNALGRAKTTIATYEQGRSVPHGDDLRAFANYFNVSTDRLLNEDLSFVTDLDAQSKADWIREELLRLRLSDKEFDMIESYIQFIISQRSK